MYDDNDAANDYRLNATKHTVAVGPRITNFVVDTLVMLPVNVFLYWQFIEFNWETGEVTGNTTMGRLVMWFFTLGYYFFLEAGIGKTIGKMVSGTKVVDEWGRQPELGAIAIRSLCRLIPFEWLSFFGPKTIGWHDSFSKTYVVDKDFRQPTDREDILDA